VHSIVVSTKLERIILYPLLLVPLITMKFTY
jgi:hypothetical protein